MTRQSNNNDPTKLEVAVENVLVENKLESVLYFSKIQKHWEIIVGQSLAKKTSPLKLSNKTLVVMAEDAAYSHHLRYFENNIIELISSPEICGEGIVKKVVFKVGETSILREKSAEKPEENTKVPSLQKELPSEAQKTADLIQDKKLKSSFSRFMSKNISKKVQ